MYLDDAPKLFEDLRNIGTIRWFMERNYLDHRRIKKPINSLIKTVYFLLAVEKKFFNYENCDSEQKRSRVLGDARRLHEISKILKKEMRSNYVMVCDHCNQTYFYDENPKNDGKQHFCEKCKKNCFSILTLGAWLIKEKLV